MQTSHTAWEQNREIAAIDVHGHYGAYTNSSSPVWNECMSGDVQTVLQRAALANIRLTVVSPNSALLPRGKADPVSGNEEAAQAVAAHDALCHWVVVHPREPETFEQARRMLPGPKCLGIKIHPEEHCYQIRKHGRALFEFAAEQGCIVQTHSGEENSLPEDFLPFAADFPEVTLILAHLGCGYDDDPTHQVRAIQKSKRGNILVDTSSARNVQSGLIEWAVREVGAEKMLFGTDSPCYFTPMQRARIDYADISTADKRKILCGNAERLFGLNHTEVR